MATDSRPLSPHLQIYKMPLSGILSITHRITGVFLSIGTIALAWFFLAAAGGQADYSQAQSCLGSIPGQIVLFGWTAALYYHLGNGIRHLIWDAGKGLDLPSVNKSGIVMIAAAVVLTILTWVVAYAA